MGPELQRPSGLWDALGPRQCLSQCIFLTLPQSLNPQEIKLPISLLKTLTPSYSVAQQIYLVFAPFTLESTPREIFQMNVIKHDHCFFTPLSDKNLILQQIQNESGKAWQGGVSFPPTWPWTFTLTISLQNLRVGLCLNSSFSKAVFSPQFSSIEWTLRVTSVSAEYLPVHSSFFVVS